jgi:hypothetical protein
VIRIGVLRKVGLPVKSLPPTLFAATGDRVDGGDGGGDVLFQTVDGGGLAAAALIRTQILDFVAVAGEPFSRW